MQTSLHVRRTDATRDPRMTGSGFRGRHEHTVWQALSVLFELLATPTLIAMRAFAG
jgi:hypothetical protein